MDFAWELGLLVKISHNSPKIGQNEPKLTKIKPKFSQNQPLLAVGRFFYREEYWTGEKGRGRKKDGF